MDLYTARHLGSKPRVKEEITHALWKGIVALLEKMEQKNFFAEAYPEGCMDNSSDIYAVDIHKLNDELEIYTGLTWPLKTFKDAEEYWIDREPYIPTKYEIFDTLELLFHKTSTPSEGFYHSFCRHSHLHFADDGIAKKTFSDELNGLFAAVGMMYELNPQTGHIETVIGAETKQLINSALSGLMMDAQYSEMLNDACIKITNFRLEVAYQALEKLWDAYERLKCYFDPKDQKEKKYFSSSYCGIVWR